MCKNTCSMCPNLVISSAVTFADGTLNINIPAGSYANGQRVCLVVAQAIPAEATIDAPVAVTIGTGTAQYPLQRRNGLQMTARQMQTRVKYVTCVATNATGGVFRLLGNYCDSARSAILPAINGTDTTAPGTG